MNTAFESIGLEIPNAMAIHHLAERVGTCGEATKVETCKGIWHGRCWKIGAEGLEVWTVLYQTGTGEIFYANCRPAFRPQKKIYKIQPWALTEYAEDGEALLHGFIENTETEVLLALQNLTEIGSIITRSDALSIGLGGLAYQARVEKTERKTVWQAVKDSKRENDWTLCGRILMHRTLRNPVSGNDLIWLYLDLGGFNLEILVNQRALRGEHPKIGATITADIWLQGYIFDKLVRNSIYEGIDAKANAASFWERLRRRN